METLYDDCACTYMCLVFLPCRNYDHHSRPKFEEIVVLLRDRPELLEIPKACLQGLPDPTGAKTLGAPLDCSYDMYYNLQHFYSK